MTEKHPYSKKRYGKALLALLLLFQFFTFSGFADVAPTRDTGTQSEWMARFTDRWGKTISFRAASRVHVDSFYPTWNQKGLLHRYNNQCRTRLAIANVRRTNEPLALIPKTAWPRSGDDEDRI